MYWPASFGVEYNLSVGTLELDEKTQEALSQSLLRFSEYPSSLGLCPNGCLPLAC